MCTFPVAPLSRREVLAARARTAGASEGMTGKLFLDTLLVAKDEHGNGMSDDDIREECDTFIFEGHDTTSAALAWATYLIGTDPKIQVSRGEGSVRGGDDGRVPRAGVLHRLF